MRRREAEPIKSELQPGQQSRLVAELTSPQGTQSVELASCTSPLDTATKLYQAHPELQPTLHVVRIVQEILEEVTDSSDGTRVERWVRRGQDTQVFINCNLVNGAELELEESDQDQVDPHALYAVPFRTTTRYLFRRNTDMLYNPLVDPDYDQKKQRRRIVAERRVAPASS